MSLVLVVRLVVPVLILVRVNGIRRDVGGAWSAAHWFTSNPLCRDGSRGRARKKKAADD